MQSPEPQQKKSLSVAKTLGSYFKKIDVYGRPAQLTFKGELVYKSNFGAFMTLGLFFGVMIYAVATLFPVLRRQSPAVGRQVYRQNLGEKDPFPLFDLGFDIAFGISTALDETYMQFEITNQTRGEIITNGRDGIDIITRYKESISIPFSKCNASNFNYSNWTEAELMGVNNLMCTDEKMQQIEGSFFNTNFTYLGFYLLRCQNSSDSDIICKSKEEIDAYLDKGVYVNLVMVNNYFDNKDYNRPIKQFLDNTLSFHTQSSYPQKVNVYVQRNQAELRDDPWGYRDSRTVEYSTFENFFDFEGPKTSNIVLAFYLRYDTSKEAYTREVQTVFNWLGSVGGLQGILFIIGSLIVNFVSLRLLDASIIQRLYLIDRQNSQKQCLQVRNTLSLTKPKLEEDSLQLIHDMMQNRQKLKYSFLQIIDLRSKFRCLAQKSKRKILFNEARHRLALDLDIVKILKSIQYIEIFKNLLLSNQQKFILKFSKSRLINYDGEPCQQTLRKSEIFKNPELFQKELQILKAKRLKDIDKKVLKELVVPLDHEEELEKDSSSPAKLRAYSSSLKRKKKSEKVRKEPITIQNREYRPKWKSQEIQEQCDDSKRVIELSSREQDY